MTPTDPDDEPTVVCASCGRSKDTPARDRCTEPDWHQPQPEVPDVDVTAEDGDDLAPMTAEDWNDAVGPRPGETWADLYARTHLSLTYTAAQLRGTQQALEDARAGLALLLRAAGGSVTVPEADAVAFAPVSHVYRSSDPRARTITWSAAP